MVKITPSTEQIQQELDQPLLLTTPKKKRRAKFLATIITIKAITPRFAQN